MTTSHHPRHRRLRLFLAVSLLVAAGFFFGPAATAANAQSDDPCAIGNFTTGTSIDFTAYSACVEAQNQEGLARTGSDTGMYVGLGSALIALGAAAVWTARRRQLTS